MATIEDFECPLAVPHHVEVTGSRWSEIKEAYIAGQEVQIGDKTYKNTDDIVIFIKDE